MGLKFRLSSTKFEWVGMIPRDGVIVTANQNMVWVYHQEDGLFSYNPQDSILKHHRIPLDGIVQRLALSPDGNLLLSQEMEGSNWTLTPGELILYNPQSSQHQKLNVPLFRWPDYGTLLYTDSGDLWIGIHGYLAQDGSWVLKNPKRYRYTNLGFSPQSYNWVHPKLLFQSSNGYLWYTAYSGDLLGVHGTAWYDPKTDTGCWFTTESGNIFEDINHTLWLLAGKRIYKYNLAEQ